MSKTKSSSSTTRTSPTRHNYDDCSEEGSASGSSNEDEVSLPRSVKSKKIQPPTDAVDYDDGMYDRGGRRRRKRSGRRRSRSRRSRSRSRRSRRRR